MERKIGETFKFEGKKLQVKESEEGSCNFCFFNAECKNRNLHVSGACDGAWREDGKNVIFVDVKEQPQEEQPQGEPQKLNLCELLKDCPKGFELYSTLHGKVNLVGIDKEKHPIIFMFTDKGVEFISRVSSEGKYLYSTKGECILFPSKDQRDWSKFTAPWYKKEKFDPKTLNPFDRVLVRDNSSCYWDCDFFSRIDNSTSIHKYITVSSAYILCIPYNDDTKHLVGTSDEAPDFYRYWED